MKKILIIINMLLLFLIISTPTYAFTPAQVNPSLLDGVTITNNGIKTSLWQLDTSGYWYYDYDGAASLDNGLFNLNYNVKIESTNSNYNQFEFYSPLSNIVIAFDISTTSVMGSYIEFEIMYNSILDGYDIFIYDTKNGFTPFTYQVPSTTYLRVYDPYFVSSNQEYLRYIKLVETFSDGYNKGYNQGILEAEYIGYDKGYHEGQQDYYNGIYLEDDLGVLFPETESVAFGNGFSRGVLSETDFDFSQLLEYVFQPFQILNKTIAFDITFGHVALISIVFGLMGFLFSLKKGRK